MSAARFGLVVALLLAGCASVPVPTWRLELRQAIEQASAASLQGRLRVAEHHWRQAHDAAAASGQAEALARVALWRCAVDQAALVWEGCASAQPYLADAGPAVRAYAAYLGVSGLSGAVAEGVPTAGEGALAVLPPAQHPVAQALSDPAGQPASLAPLLAAIDDPLARLVAGGVAWRAGRLDRGGVALLVETASAQGWRRPLAAWLAVLAELAERQGDQTAAEAARRRLTWVLQTKPPAAAPAIPASSR